MIPSMILLVIAVRSGPEIRPEPIRLKQEKETLVGVRRLAGGACLFQALEGKIN